MGQPGNRYVRVRLIGCSRRKSALHDRQDVREQRIENTVTSTFVGVEYGGRQVVDGDGNAPKMTAIVINLGLGGRRREGSATTDNLSPARIDH